MTTDDAGRYSFTGLRMGNYSVEIAGFPGDEVGFSNTTSDVSVAVGESKIVSFDGTYLRTAGLSGQVRAEGDPLKGVTVNLRGGPDGVDESTTTDPSGQYAFASLRAGDYQVGISGFDADDYEFDATSKSVTLTLGQTGTVDFEGTLLRTSSVSGRVSVEGEGLDSVTVTITGGDLDAARTTTTSAGGQYAFSGLAAGTYTVAISGQDTTAHVFESTSASVTVGDDEEGIVNFEGAHATTASVSGNLFIDEVTKDGQRTEGEDLLAQDSVVVTLIGPGLNQIQIAHTNAEGRFTFANLRKGLYSLQVLGAGIPEDHGFGGPTTGYPINLGVGKPHIQHIPIVITHQRVHFQVNLRNGEGEDATGDALPGAKVHLYSSMTSQDAIATAEADSTGMAHLHFARSATTGHTAYAAITAPDGFLVAGDRQMVSWEGKAATAEAANSQHVVNAKATVSFSGKTIQRGEYGGKALSGWAISVQTKDTGDKMVAVEGAPTALDADGTAKVEMSVTDAADLPMTYYITLAEAQHDSLDGGESYVTNDTVKAEFTGLSVETEMEAEKPLVVRYTTQTLKVYIHHEIDQIHGYTGPNTGGDVRDNRPVSLGIRYVSDTNRRATFDRDEWNEQARGITTRLRGVVTYRNVPAHRNVFVTADAASGQNVTILEPTALDAFQNHEANGITGGAFGDNGGYHHTVELCPLSSDQRQGGAECGSFAFVKNYIVAAHVNQMLPPRVVNGEFPPRGAADNAGRNRLSFAPGIALGLNRVESRNLAGESLATETLRSPVQTRVHHLIESSSDYEPNTTTGRVSVVDERQDLYFGRMAAGEYSIALPDGWGATHLERQNISDIRLRDDAVQTKDEDGNDFARDAENARDSVYLEVRPTTGTLYGRVTDPRGYPEEGVTVEVNGESATTDRDGNYVVNGYGNNYRFTFPASRRNQLYVRVSKDGFESMVNNPQGNPRDLSTVINGSTGSDDILFAANSPRRLNIQLAENDTIAIVTGTVLDKNDQPVPNVQIRVERRVPGGNPNRQVLRNYARTGSGSPSSANRFVRTGSDGSYRLEIHVGKDDDNYRITPSLTGWFFDDIYEEESLESGDEESDVNFEALRLNRIRGSVRMTENGAGLSNIRVVATNEAVREDSPHRTRTATTNSGGFFEIGVPEGNFDVSVSPQQGYSFAPPESDDHERINLDDDERHDIEDPFTVNHTFGARNFDADRDVTGNSGAAQYDYDNSLTATFRAGDPPQDSEGTDIDVTWAAQIRPHGADEWVAAGTPPVADGAGTLDVTDIAALDGITAAQADGAFDIRVVARATIGETPVEVPSSIVRVPAIDPRPSDEDGPNNGAWTATRNTDPADDSLDITWTPTTPTNERSRYVVQVEFANDDGKYENTFTANPTGFASNDNAGGTGETAVATIQAAVDRLSIGDDGEVTVRIPLADIANENGEFRVRLVIWQGAAGALPTGTALTTLPIQIVNKKALTTLPIQIVNKK